MDAKAITKAAGEAAIAATSEDALVEAFDRVDNAIDAWQLNTVDEEEEEEEDTGPMEEDGTFLTGALHATKPDCLAPVFANGVEAKWRAHAHVMCRRGHRGAPQEAAPQEGGV